MACKAGKGIPRCVLQEKEKNHIAQQSAQSTVKVAVLEGDPVCTNIIASSVYDTNPVHYLSMVYELIQWVDKENMVYNVDTG